jgi:hypothetical protein
MFDGIPLIQLFWVDICVIVGIGPDAMMEDIILLLKYLPLITIPHIEFW